MLPSVAYRARKLLPSKDRGRELSTTWASGPEERSSCAVYSASVNRAEESAVRDTRREPGYYYCVHVSCESTQHEIYRRSGGKNVYMYCKLIENAINERRRRREGTRTTARAKPETSSSAHISSVARVSPVQLAYLASPKFSTSGSKILEAACIALAAELYSRETSFTDIALFFYFIFFFILFFVRNCVKQFDKRGRRKKRFLLSRVCDAGVSREGDFVVTRATLAART